MHFQAGVDNLEFMASWNTSRNVIKFLWNASFNILIVNVNVDMFIFLPVLYIKASLNPTNWTMTRQLVYLDSMSHQSPVNKNNNSVCSMQIARVSQLLVVGRVDDLHRLCVCITWPCTQYRQRSSDKHHTIEKVSPAWDWDSITVVQECWAGALMLMRCN